MRLSDLNWKHPPYVYLSERKEDDHVAVTPSRIIFVGWLRGLEPCSPHSQCGTLPDKLKSTFVIEIGLLTFFHFYLCSWIPLRSISNQYRQFQKPLCCRCTTQQSAVRTRVELVASDRQSEMLAVTLTNLYSRNNTVATMLSRVCSLYRPDSYRENRYPQVESLRS